MIIGLVEYDKGKLNERSLEMLTLARGLAGQLGTPLAAVLFGEAARDVAGGLSAYGVSVVTVVTHAQLPAGSYAPQAWARCLAQLIESTRPEAVLAAGSERGNEVLAYLGALSRLPMAANCIAVEPGATFLVTRQCWGGTLWQEARLSGEPKLLSIAPLAIAAETVAASNETAITDFTPTLADSDLLVRVLERIETGGDKVTLAEARAVVGGGRGVGSAEGFKPLEELAGLLGAAVGCSRAVTSSGWRPHADQIGQTGTRISPELYIACGVSGATQHLVGCKGSKHILAINTDPDAPIINAADYAIIGDLHTILPALSAAVRKRRAAG
jgi:electron transfer flavoprotein alpha subunit